jgi:hypothetical protein
MVSIKYFVLLLSPYVALATAVPQPAPLTDRSIEARANTGGLYVDFILTLFRMVL